MPQEHEVSLRERVKSPPAPAMIDSYYRTAVAAGIRYQFEPEMRIHLAHALMLARQGIVGAQDAARILRVLLDLQRAGPDVLTIDYRQEDLYSYIERYIVEKLGRDVGGRLHTARSRNDLHTTSWRLALRGHLLAALDTLDELRTVALDLAQEHAETVMPGYTHTQHAQPISFGYYLLAVADLLARDHRRLRGALDCCDRSPLGAGALAGTGFPIDRDYVRDFLGFASLAEVAYDAVSCRDDAQEAAAALAILMTGVSRLATDLQSWNTLEYGFIELADEYSSVSSIMPQKKNPQALEHVKASAAHVTGALTTVLACAKNTALADVNDGVTAPNVPVLEATERTRLALRVINGVLRTLTVRPEVMRRSAEIGFGTATELADVIVRETGISFRMAHNVVGRVVRETIEAGRTAMDIGAEDLDRVAAELFGKPLGIAPEVIRTALDPMENIRLRSMTGGPAPDTVRGMIAERRSGLADDRDQVAQVRERIQAATERLMAEAERAAEPATAAGGVQEATHGQP